MTNVRQTIELETKVRTLKAENKQMENKYDSLNHFSNKQTEVIKELLKGYKAIKKELKL